MKSQTMWPLCLLLGILFSRFIHVVSLIHFFSWPNDIPLYRYTTYIYSFISWWIFGLLPCFDLLILKMDNIEEIYKFLEMYNLLRLSQEEMENMSRPIATLKLSKLKRINSQQTKLQDQMAPQVNPSENLQKNHRGKITPKLIL